jgi:TM2 domain-containing membrane protein YozV
LFWKQPIPVSKIFWLHFSGFFTAVLLLLAIGLPASGQEKDTINFQESGRLTAQEQDTVAITGLDHTHSPRKAVIYSLICPGLGQIYNKKYWKLPIIYGAGGAFVYFIVFNQMKYAKFRDTYINNTGAEADDVFRIDGLKYRYSILPRGRDYYRRYRDLSVLGMGAIYLLTVMDTMVDAYFFSYDVSDDLTMKLEPAIIEGPGITASVGFRINLGF